MYLNNVVLIRVVVNDCLSQASSLYQEWCKDTSFKQHLAECQKNLHQSYGVLSVAGLEAAAKLVRDIEISIDQADEENDIADIVTPLLFKKLSLAIQQYLDSLVMGEVNMYGAMELYPVYCALMQARGETNYHQSDLFFPVIDYRHFGVKSKERKQSDISDLTDLRKQFQQGLLHLLRDGQSTRSDILDKMYEIVGSIIEEQSSPNTHLFWTASQKLILIVKLEELDYSGRIRRLLARIDQQFNQMIKGSNTISERLLQEILYFLIRSDSTNTEVINFISAVGLNYIVDANHSINDISIDDDSRQLIRDAIQALQMSWECFSSGDKEAITAFSRQLEHLQETIVKIDNDSLNILLKEINVTTTLLETAPKELTKSLAMEMATALLVLELITQDFTRLETDFKQHLIAMSQRLSFALAGDISMSGAPELPGKDIILSLQQQHLKQELSDTLIQNMHQVEHELDGFFRDPDPELGFFKVYDKLDEVAALLTSLDEVDTCHAVKYLKKMIKNFVSEFDPTEFEKAVDLFCAIEFYLGIIGQANTRFEDMLLKAGLDVNEITGSSEDFSEEITIVVHPTIEQELSQEMSKTKDLFDSWRDKGKKQLRKKELKDNLESIKQDAIITGDDQLEAITDEALGALKSSSAKNIDPTLEKSISMIAPDSSSLFESEQITVEVEQEELDQEMVDIFLEEAEQVLVDIDTALAVLSNDDDNLDAITGIRRGFHTLKGSSRMVGLNRFGDLSWEVEDLLNKVLPSFEKISADLLLLLQEAHKLFDKWRQQLLEGNDDINIQPFQELLENFCHGEPLVSANTSSTEAASSEKLTEAGASDPDSTESSNKKINIGDISISPALYQIFMDEARKLLNVLLEQCQKLRESSEYSGTNLLWATHTLSGIAGTVRMSAIHEIAREYELLVKRLFESSQQLSDEQYAILDNVNHAFIEMVNAVGKQQKPNQRDDLKEQLMHIRQTLGQDKTEESMHGGDVEFDSDLHSLSLIEKIESRDWNTNDVTFINEAVNEPWAEEISLSGLLETPQNTDSITENVDIAAAYASSKTDRRKKQFDDDIDPELLEVFLDEAQELIPQIGKDLREWRTQPHDDTAPQSLKRLLHTMKGSARMAGAMTLGELVHDMETRVENAVNLNSIPSTWFDVFELSYDRANVLLDRLRDTGQELSMVMPELTDADSENSGISLAGSTILLGKNAFDETLHPDKANDVRTEEKPQAVQEKEQSQRHVKLRVRSDVADRLVNQAGQVNITRTRAEDRLRNMKGSLDILGENVSRMRNQVREIEIQAETQIKSKFSMSDDEQASFDPLEFDRFTRLQELTRFLGENINDVTDIQQTLTRDIEQTFNVLGGQSRLGRELQQELMGVRMTPFSSITERLYRIARLNSKEVGKRINLDIQGAHVELDRVILEHITAPLEHLLRNAIAHGLEHSEQRVQSGKTAIGEVKLELRKEGNEVVITLKDDGAGLHLEGILKTALSKGIVSPEENLTEQQIRELIFVSGFSTAKEVTQLAGRGVGMDVVRDEINSLGGRIEVRSELGQGTEFVIYLPLSLNVTQAVMVQVGQQLFAIPSTMFVQIQQYSVKGIAELNEAGQLQNQGKTYSYHYLPHLLGYTNAKPELGRSNPVLLLRSGNNFIAVLVDGLRGNREITIKRLGGHMAYIPGITGATVLGNGEVAMILNPVQLALHQLSNPIVDMSFNADEHNADDNIAAVMIVDDSLTVRKIAGRLLSRAGYHVITAKDGVEALEVLNESLPDAMLVDVEMPRMDGFELSRQVRGTPEYAGIPIIMITSRTAEKHRQIAKEIGVDEFLGKPYQDEQVLEHLARLTSKREDESD